MTPRCGWLPLVSVALLGCASGRVYPEWRPIAPTARSIECAEVDTWVKRSTKSGLGLIVSARGQTEQRCQVQLLDAQLEIEGKSPAIAPAAPQQARAFRLTERDTVFLYVPFVFNANQAWNDGDRTAVFHVSLNVNGRPHQTRWQLDFAQWETP